ncbi:MAG: nitrous oxide reductase accessory protein NosL [Thermodesulfobacteriota bacterium]
MDNRKKMNRRQALKVMAVAGTATITGLYVSQAQAQKVGAMMPGKGWLKQGAGCDGDGTPLQFIPKVATDPEPLKDELKKYPTCPYCGMNRSKWHHSRHLVHYDDNLVDGTCSIHCLALSLSLNLDRGIKAIYAADFGADSSIKPLINVDTASYLLGSKLKGTMSAKSKMAFAVKNQATAAQKANGGEIVDFDNALKEAYLGMAKDTLMIRKRRAEKRKKMMQMKKK